MQTYTYLSKQYPKAPSRQQIQAFVAAAQVCICLKHCCKPDCMDSTHINAILYLTPAGVQAKQDSHSAADQPSTHNTGRALPGMPVCSGNSLRCTKTCDTAHVHMRSRACRSLRIVTSASNKASLSNCWRWCKSTSSNDQRCSAVNTS